MWVLTSTQVFTGVFNIYPCNYLLEYLPWESLKYLPQCKLVITGVFAELISVIFAQVVLGTVTAVDEAVQWLSYTYFFVRARLNPMAYGIKHAMKQLDPELFSYRTDLICQAAVTLDKYQMIVYNPTTGTLRLEPIWNRFMFAKKHKLHELHTCWLLCCVDYSINQAIK